jgi:hypothetical protein
MLDNVVFVLFGFVLLVVFVLGGLVGRALGGCSMVSHKEAIQHGAAHYDPVTAKFTWNSSATAPIMAEAQKP